MADYKKYAEDLIGDWERDQYAPQKEILENIYQTNWNRLSNDFSDLKDKLARNFQNARLDYANILNDIQDDSFNRMRGAAIDLATRGLSSSGVGNMVTQADTRLKGTDVDKALTDLLNVNNASISGYVGGLDTYGNKQTKLANQVEGDFGKLTDAEAANGQQYANLIAGLGESAANRDLSNATASAKAAAQRAQEEADDLERRLLIYDTLASEDLTDDQKAKYLHAYLGVDTIDTAREAVKAYNNNAKMDKNQDRINKLNNNINKVYDINNFLGLLGKLLPYNPRYLAEDYVVKNGPQFLTDLYVNSRNKKINELQKENDSMTYEDLYKILYGND